STSSAFASLFCALGVAHGAARDRSGRLAPLSRRRRDKQATAQALRGGSAQRGGGRRGGQGSHSRAAGLGVGRGAHVRGYADVQERTIRFGHLNNADHPVSFGVKRFGELVAAKSGGKMKVQEYPASTLGNEMQQQSALQGGVQEMSAPATTSLAGIVKEFGLV